MESPLPLPIPPFRVVALTAVLAAGSGAAALGTERLAPPSTPIASATLLADQRAIAPGRPFTLALRLAPADGWHTYWRNPGDSGLATAIDWQLPPGFASGPILWPFPQRFSAGPITSYGYKGEVLLLIDMMAPLDLQPGGQANIAALADWLVCREICVPESAELTLTLPVAAHPIADPGRQDAVARARAALPAKAQWLSRYATAGDAVRLVIDSAGALTGDDRPVWFYPYDSLAISHGAPQKARVEGGVLTIEMTTAAAGISPPDPLAGVLVIGTGPRARAAEIAAHRQPTDLGG